MRVPREIILEGASYLDRKKFEQEEKRQWRKRWTREPATVEEIAELVKKVKSMTPTAEQQIDEFTKRIKKLQERYGQK